MDSYFSSDFKLGILGGGQLGKMLLLVAQKYDINTYVLDPDKNAPCAKICNAFKQGDLSDEQTVFAFGKQVDILTIEIEHINIAALYRLEKIGVKVYPQPHIIETIQDKSKQKQFYKKYQIPTANFSFFPDLNALKNNPPALPFIWKSTHLGYDGMGVKSIKSQRDLDKLLKNVPIKQTCIAEEKIDFQKEIAVIVARNMGGQIVHYPLVAMDFHPAAHQLEYLIAPADVDKKVAQKAIALARQIATIFQYVGLMAVEMFVTKENEILVNEIAPRVHNSGHHTIESAYTSQFEQHLRAILDLPLGNCDLKFSAVMANLVGDSHSKGKVCYENLEKIFTLKGAYLHIYGKKQTQPFRKMGHITVVKKNTRKALQVAKKLKNQIKIKGDLPVDL